MAVTARRSLGQIGKTIVRTFVDKRQAQTVDFALHREGHIGVFSFHRIHKAADLIIGKHIKQRKHRYTVFNRNTENTLAANNLCRAVSGHELRMCRFDITNLVHHGIVFLIRYNRSILLIVGGTPFFSLCAEAVVVFFGRNRQIIVRHNILPHVCYFFVFYSVMVCDSVVAWLTSSIPSTKTVVLIMIRKGTPFCQVVFARSSSTRPISACILSISMV